MSGPYHERAVCECGWTAICTFGDLFHLTHHGRFINVCPDCGRPKSLMEVMVLRWQDGTWRDRQGQPYNGVEPTPAAAVPIIYRRWFGPVFFVLLTAAIIAVSILGIEWL